MIDRRLVLIIAMLAVFALATQAVVWFLAPREEESAFVGPPRSDYTLTDFTLDALDELKVSVLSGALEPTTLTKLKAVTAGLRDASGDPGLDQVLAEIELRVEVEIAKMAPRR